MLKTIFAKLMGTYLIIMFLALALLGGLIAQLFQNYYFTEKEELLVAQGKEINRLVSQYLHGNITIDHLTGKLETMDRILNARIWIADAHGLIYEESGSEQDRWLGTRLDRSEVQLILQGKTITKIGRYGNRFDAAMLSVAVPLVLNGEVRGATLLHLPIFGIEQSLGKVYKLIWAAALIAVGLGSILIYLMSRKFAKPLYQMNSVALQLAKGKFDQQVEIHGEDEIAQLGQSFNFMAAQLNKLELMRREFIANVSHELRSPLTSIKGFVQAMLDGTVPVETQGKYLSMVFEETTRMTRLVNDLLDIASIDGGRVQLEKSVFDLGELAAKVVRILQPQIVAKALKVEQEIKPDEFWVEADQHQIEQVLVNLVNNAIGFTPDQGSIALEVSAQGKRVIISVKDSGIGIPKEDLEYIWERFYKVDKARIRTRGGTGLGLAIVKRIIDAHGEEIWVHSKVNEGTQFSFTLSRSIKKAHSTIAK